MLKTVSRMVKAHILVPATLLMALLLIFGVSTLSAKTLEMPLRRDPIFTLAFSTHLDDLHRGATTCPSPSVFRAGYNVHAYIAHHLDRNDPRLDWAGSNASVVTEWYWLDDNWRAVGEPFHKEHGKMKEGYLFRTSVKIPASKANRKVGVSVFGTWAIGTKRGVDRDTEYGARAFQTIPQDAPRPEGKKCPFFYD